MNKDADIIKQILDGNTQAFAKLIDLYKDMSFAVVKSILKDSHIAQEVLHNVFVIVFKKLHTFKFEAKFSTWLYAIIVREAFKYQKQNSKQHIALCEKMPIQDTSLSTNVFYEIEKKEKATLIKNMLNTLSPQENLVLQLFYLDELRLDEISVITEWNVSKIKILLHRARKNCKAFLNRQKI